MKTNLSSARFMKGALIFTSMLVLICITALPSKFIKVSANLLENPSTLNTLTYSAVGEIVQFNLPSNIEVKDLDIGILGEKSKIDYVTQSELGTKLLTANAKALSVSSTDNLLVFLGTKAQPKVGKATVTKSFRYFGIEKASGKIFEFAPQPIGWSNKLQSVKPNQSLSGGNLIARIDSLSLSSVEFGTALNRIISKAQFDLPFSVINRDQDKNKISIKIEKLIDEPLQIILFKKSAETQRLKKDSKRPAFKSAKLAQAVEIGQKVGALRIIPSQARLQSVLSPVEDNSESSNTTSSSQQNTANASSAASINSDNSFQEFVSSIANDQESPSLFETLKPKNKNRENNASFSSQRSQKESFSNSSSAKKCYVCLYGEKANDDDKLDPKKECEKKVKEKKRQGYDPALAEQLINEMTGQQQGMKCYCSDPEVEIIAHGSTECNRRAFEIAKQILDSSDGKINSCGIYDWGCSAYGTICEAHQAAEALSKKMKKMGLSPNVEVSVVGHQNTHLHYNEGMSLEKLKYALKGQLDDIKTLLCNSNSKVQFSVCASGAKTDYPDCHPFDPQNDNSYCLQNNDPGGDDGQDYYPDCKYKGKICTQTCLDNKWTEPKPKQCKNN